jgi:hypothetical protein
VFKVIKHKPMVRNPGDEELGKSTRLKKSKEEKTLL